MIVLQQPCRTYFEETEIVYGTKLRSRVIATSHYADGERVNTNNFLEITEFKKEERKDEKINP